MIGSHLELICLRKLYNVIKSSYCEPKMWSSTYFIFEIIGCVLMHALPVSSPGLQMNDRKTKIAVVLCLVHHARTLSHLPAFATTILMPYLAAHGL